MKELSHKEAEVELSEALKEAFPLYHGLFKGHVGQIVGLIYRKGLRITEIDSKTAPNQPKQAG